MQSSQQRSVGVSSCQNEKLQEKQTNKTEEQYLIQGTKRKHKFENEKKRAVEAFICSGGCQSLQSEILVSTLKYNMVACRRLYCRKQS